MKTKFILTALIGFYIFQIFNGHGSDIKTGSS